MATVADTASRRINASPLAGWTSLSAGWFVGGTALSLFGFAFPWFRVGPGYEWWYGGWGMLTTNEPALWWIGLIFLGYAILVLGGSFLIRAEIAGAAVAAALAVAVALATLIVVALAAADAVNDLGRVYRLDLSLGLFAMLPGHGIMITAAFAGLVLQFLRAAELAPAAAPDEGRGAAHAPGA